MHFPGIRTCIMQLAALILISAFAFWVNRDIVIKGLYMDDLYMWSCYGEHGLLEFAFPIGTSTRFRPVYWLATYLQMAIIGTHVDRFAAFNVVINIFAAMEIFYMAKRIAKDGLTGYAAGLISAICYLASRFSYYQIGQALGLMETMGLMMALYVFYRLFMYSRNGACEKGFYSALLMYFLIVFVHERYLCLFPLFYLALIIKVRWVEEGSRYGYIRQREILLKWIMPAVVLMLIVAIRTFAIGTALPAGTGGTEVTDTFNICQAISFCIDQVLYIFGVNAGPEYLNGLEWVDTPWQIKRAVKYGVLFIGLLCIFFALSVIVEAVNTVRKKDLVLDCGKLLWDNVSAVLMFISFIALCIGCSSVTIRVEMRWIYVSYAAALLFASYMLGAVKAAAELYLKEKGTSAAGTAVVAAAVIMFLLYGILSTGTNIFYRGYFDRLYFWPDQLRMNSLAEETIEKYGTKGVFGKDIYIIGNTYGMSEFYADTFFKPYDPEKKAEGTDVIFIESITDVPAEEVRDGHALVLIEVPEENAYRDITEDLK